MAKRRTRGEGTIFYSEAEKCWIAEVVLPDGKAKRKRSKKQAVVREWLQITLSELRQGTFVDSASWDALGLHRPVYGGYRRADPETENH